jgi:serine/threonine-protein kinase
VNELLERQEPLVEPPRDVPTERPDSLAGTRVADRYEVHDLIGVGGTCQVYLATDTLLDIPVALKRVRPDYIHRDEFRKRMIKEARRGRIADPRIASIHEVVTWNDELMLVMEYVKGTSLTKTIENGLPMRDFWRMARECLEALRAAHEKNLIHRDIKPDNIMVTEDGSIKILDFGLAHRIPGGEVDFNQSTGEVDFNQSTVSVAVPAGTPRYMSPEAFSGAELDARADIFSLGVVFYQMLCGLPPFQARNWSELNDEIRHFDPPPPCQNREVSGRLSRVVMKMIAKNPDDRYASCDEVLGALEHARPGDLPVRKILWAVGILAVIGLATQAPRIVEAVGNAVKPPIPSPTVLVVMPFEWVGGDERELDWARGLSELVSDDLALHRDPRGYSVVRVSEAGEGTIANLYDARELLGASLAISGEIDQVGPGLRADISVQRTSGGLQRLRHATVTVESGEMRELAWRCQVELRRMLEIDAPDADRWERVHGPHSDGPFREYLQGVARLRAGDRPAATEVLDRATAIDRKYAAAHAALAMASSSVSDAEEAVRLDPELPEAYLALARAQSAAGDLESSVQSLTRAIEFEDAPLEAWLDLILTLAAIDPEARDNLLDEAVAKWPGWLKPLLFRSFFRSEDGDYDSAIDDSRETTRLAPEDYATWAYYGGFLLLRGRYEEAIEACQEALALRRDSASFSNLATAYFNLRRFEDAASTYHDALQSNPSDYRVWRNLGDACSQFDPQEARDHYTVAIDHALSDPGSETRNPPAATLAWLYAATDQPEQAQEQLDRALGFARLQNRELEACALAAWRLGQRELALELLQRALANEAVREWIRDSALYDEWRQDPEFAAILSDGPS